MIKKQKTFKNHYKILYLNIKNTFIINFILFSHILTKLYKIQVSGEYI